MHLRFSIIFLFHSEIKVFSARADSFVRKKRNNEALWKEMRDQLPKNSSYWLSNDRELTCRGDGFQQLQHQDLTGTVGHESTLVCWPSHMKKSTKTKRGRMWRIICNPFLEVHEKDNKYMQQHILSLCSRVNPSSQSFSHNSTKAWWDCPKILAVGKDKIVSSHIIPFLT